MVDVKHPPEHGLLQYVLLIQLKYVNPCSVSSFLLGRLQSKTVTLIHLDNNEAAFSLAVVPFAARGGELHLVVGTASDTLVTPRSCTSGFLRTYKFVEDGAGLELVHKTETDDVPLAVMAFQGRLAAGVGKALRIYEIGKKKLLRKAENKVGSFTRGWFVTSLDL